MRFDLLFALCPIVGLVVLDGQVGTSIDALIQQLGSSDFRRREIATKALLERPESEAKIRAAIGDADREVSLRASNIVAEFERRRLAATYHELDSAIAAGRMEQVIELILEWPEERLDNNFWDRVKLINSELVNCHKKTGNQLNPWHPRLIEGRVPVRKVLAGRYSELGWDMEKDTQTFFLRAREIAFDATRINGFNKGLLLPTPVVFSNGPVHFQNVFLPGVNIFATGSVKIQGTFIDNALIVSGGDVTLDCALNCCLIIAKGSVTIRNWGLDSVRIISGKSAIFDEKLGDPRFRDVSENESNPLGYIRWSATPAGDKKEPKAPNNKK